MSADDAVILTNLISRIFSRTGRIPAARGRDIDGDLRRGYCLQRAGDHAGAAHCYREVLALDARNANAHYLLGALLGETGNVAEASVHLDHALAAKPDLAAAHAARGNVFLLLDEREAAVASYRRALSYEPDNATAHFNLGLILRNSGAREQASTGARTVSIIRRWAPSSCSSARSAGASRASISRQSSTGSRT